MPRSLSVFLAAASLAATAVASYSMLQVRALEARLASHEPRPAPPPKPLTAPPDPRVDELRAEVEALRAELAASRPAPVELDAAQAEKAVEEALARRPEVVANAIEELAAEAARRDLSDLALHLSLTADQIEPLGVLLADTARKKARLLIEAKTEDAMKRAEAETARLHAERDEAIRARLTVEQRARYATWVQQVDR
jgi:hypothetical protein